MNVFLVMMFCALVTGKAPLYKRKNKIEGSYIVSFKSDRDVKTSAANIKSLLSSSRKGKLNRQYSKAFKGFSATLSEKDLELIRDLDFVDYVEEDEKIQASVEWGLDRIDQHDGLSGNVYNPKGKGKDVDVYVLDTGINTNHQDFMGRASNDEDFSLTPTNGGDCNGHGTHVAGIIAKVAKEATIHGVRVLDCFGYGTTSSVLAGMEFVENYEQ